MREHVVGEVEKRKNAPSVGNKLPPAPHNDGEPRGGEAARSHSLGDKCHFDRVSVSERSGEISRATLQIHFNHNSES